MREIDSCAFLKIFFVMTVRIARVKSYKELGIRWVKSEGKCVMRLFSFFPLLSIYE